MGVGPPTSEYRAAVEELLAPLAKLERQVRECALSLERMKRFRFKSQSKEKAVAAYIREGAAKMAPLLSGCNLDGLAEWLGQMEVAATAAAKEE
jgi:hypothetical protein